MAWFDFLNVDVLEENLFEVDTEAIVCSIRVNGNLYGKTSRRLYELCGLPLQQEIIEKLKTEDHNSLPLGGAISLNASRFGPTKKFKRIILAALWGERENDYTSNLVYGVISNSLREAFKCDLSSLALPILKLNKDTIKDQTLYAQTVVKVLKEFNELKNSDSFPVEELLFISDKPAKVEFLQNYIDRL